MNKTASKNKQRGRAFQAKLAEMSGGMNIGTLGGEDVMHEEFSYEAKTYHPKAKSNKGRMWVGEKIMSELEEKYGAPVLGKVVTTDSNEPIVIMRWNFWNALSEEDKDDSFNVLIPKVVMKNRFKGRTYMKQAESNCPDGKVPVVVVHTIGERHVKDIVLIYSIYWNSLLKKLFDKNV